jgi:Brp/Blh family beta-carotene 15,15'-monooxygenase
VHGATRAGGGDASRFREVAFRRLPLAVMATAVIAGAVFGSHWSVVLAPLPWIVALAVVGLPHGGADFAVSHRAWQGRPLALVWLAYGAAMAAVLAGFVAAPVAMIVAFTVFSCWHFGTAHLDTESGDAAGHTRPAAALLRGCLVLAVPLAVWPEATAAVAIDLAALAVGPRAATELVPAAAVRATGLGLAAVSVAAALAEAVMATRSPSSRWSRVKVLGDLAVIACLGCFTDPLFSVGLYFLAWHGWRQMEPLAESLAGARPRSWSALGGAIVHIHRAALPLLVPTWAAIGAAWWLWSPDHSPRALAIVSIAAYLVVTPAHELLGDLLRQMVGQQIPGSLPATRCLQPGRHG